MKITIKAYSIYSDILAREFNITLDEEVSLGKLLENLKLKYNIPEKPEPVVLVNGEPAQPGRILRDGDVIYIAPPFSGG